MSGIGSPLTNLGQAAGSQAQFNQLLQLLQKIVASLGTGGLEPFQVYPWTQAGDLNIATAFPNVASGLFVIRQTVAAAINVTLPSSGGPWGVADGAGIAGADHITVLPSGGQTILGGASDTLSSNWKVKTYVIDGANLLIQSQS
ncbi:MAG TPA: hypothetical protein VGG45_16155 [Terracidiphilus sp.]|jgi:hypothetical protein